MKGARKLPDFTKEFRDMIARIFLLPSIIFLNIGGRGSGKTAQMFKYFTLIWEAIMENSEHTCAIVFFNAPETFMTKLKEFAPGDMHPYFYRVTRIREIDAIKQAHKYIVLCYDEGQRELNAKKALTKAMRRLEMMIAISRQKDLFLICNTQIQNVNKTLRTMTDIRTYKGNTVDMIEETDNNFAKEHKSGIMNLYNPEKKALCLFESSYSHFMRLNSKGEREIIHSGKLDLDLYQIVPWWNEKISRAYEAMDVSFDAEYDEFKAQDPLIMQSADLFEESFPDINAREINAGAVQGWLRRNYSELYYDAGDLIKDITNELKQRALIKKQAEKDKSTTAAPTTTLDPIDPGVTFPDFLKTTLGKTDPQLADLAWLWANGTGYREIADVKKTTLNQVQTILKDFQLSKSGYLFQDWFIGTHGGDVRGAVPKNDHNPDFLPPDGRIFSLKCMATSEKSKHFELPKDCRPEHDEALKQGKHYFIAYYNPKWGIVPQIKEVDPALKEPAINFYKPEK